MTMQIIYDRFDKYIFEEGHVYDAVDIIAISIIVLFLGANVYFSLSELFEKRQSRKIRKSQAS